MSKKSKYASKDFTKESLPMNRKELFGDIFKLHHSKLFLCGAIIFLFAIPLILIWFLKDYFYINQQNLNLDIRMFSLIFSIAEIPAFLILSIGFAGIARILRSFSWMEPVFFKLDFSKSVKDNIKPTMISFLIAGVVNLVFDATYLFVNNGFIRAIPFGFNYFIIFPVLLQSYFINSIYTNKYSLNLKLGIYYYFKTIIFTLLFCLIFYGINIYANIHFVYLAGVILKYCIITIVIILLLPVILQIASLYEMKVFDKNINASRFPELINKGLYKPTEFKEFKK